MPMWVMMTRLPGVHCRDAKVCPKVTLRSSRLFCQARNAAL